MDNEWMDTLHGAAPGPVLAEGDKTCDVHVHMFDTIVF